jgi:hypothetical protein
MKQIYEGDPIMDVLETADRKVEVSGYQGVAVESTDLNGQFEGTLLYFPGVKVKQLGV